MKLNLLLAALLSSLSVACYAADAVSGATPNHAAPGSQIKNVDAVTSASIVPEKLRISAKATGFTDSKAKKVLFVVGDPRFDQSLEGFLVNTAANWLTWQGYLLFLIGGKDGSWASANLGVIVALLVGLFGALAFQRGDIAKQEADLPASETADAIEAK